MLKQTIYSNFEKKELLRQFYPEIALGVPIPESRFELELPDPARFSNISEILERRLSTARSYDDWVRAQGTEGFPADSTAEAMGFLKPKSPQVESSLQGFP